MNIDNKYYAQISISNKYYAQKNINNKYNAQKNINNKYYAKITSIINTMYNETLTRSPEKKTSIHVFTIIMLSLSDVDEQSHLNTLA